MSAFSATPSRARAAKRRLFVSLLAVVPFPVKLWIARRIAPNLVRYLPAGRTVGVDGYAGRYRLELSTDFPIETMMIANIYEPDTRLVVQRLVLPGDSCIDVGANVGGITFYLAASSGATGRVLAFEPAPNTFARLCRNIGLNPELTDRVVPVQAGLAERPGELRLVEDQTVPGNAALFEAGGVRVPVATLDHAVADYALARVDFVKIDVEGMEYEVLRGAVASLKTFMPVLYFETMTHHETVRGSPQFALIEQLLIPMGYQLFDVSPQGALVPAQAASHGHNTLAVPAIRLDEIRSRLSGTSR